MENASKALLIAGSILIVIVLVSISILILNSTSEVTDQAQTTSASAAVQSENSTFTQYFGNSVKGPQVKALIQEIIVFNSSNTNEPIKLNYYKYNKDTKKTDKVSTHNSTSEKLQVVYTDIENTANYKITITSGCGFYKNRSVIQVMGVLVV